MYYVVVSYDPVTYDDAITALWEMGTLGIIEDTTGIRAFFGSKEQACAAAAALGGVAGEANVCGLPELSNDAEWDPLIVGDRFFIAPSSSPLPTPSGRLCITIDAQSAFGSGRHESTQLMLQAIERLLEPGMAVADIGCGSGILSSAALLLGGRVFACDIDANAVSIARRRADILVFAGSADALKTSTADLVLANISARVVDLIAPDLHRIAKPHGRIVISGFLQERIPDRFHPESILRLGEWQCWICVPDPVLAAEQVPPTPHSQQWW